MILARPVLPRGAVFLVCAIFLSLPSGCREELRGNGAGSEQGGEAHAGEEHAEEVVRLAKEVLDEFEVRVETAGPGPIVESVTLPAEVRPNQDRLAHISPRFPGIVQDVRKQIGDVVRAGEVLAVVESSESLAPYSLKTLIDGVVIAKHVTRGEPVSQGTECFVVADLSTVWVDLGVSQKHLPRLRVGQPVVVSAGHGLPEAQGVLSYVAPVVDEETRTAIARVVLPNPEGVWRPGLFVTARVEIERAEVPVAVPETALQMVEGETAIFVETGEGFVARPVVLGRRGDGLVEIRSGLAPNERYVARGGFTLKAELARGELGGGHGH